MALHWIDDPTGEFLPATHRARQPRRVPVTPTAGHPLRELGETLLWVAFGAAVLWVAATFLVRYLG